jgi:hypothetical protein
MNQIRPYRIVAGLVLVAALAMLAGSLGSAGAAPPSTPVPPSMPTPTAPPVPPALDTVTITILGIRATNEATPHIDPALQPIANELRGSKFNSFRLAVSDKKILPLHGATTLPMTEGYSLRVQAEKGAGDSFMLTLSWLKSETGADGREQMKTLQKMQIQIVKNKYFLSGGWELKEGALWAAVSAK